MRSPVGCMGDLFMGNGFGGDVNRSKKSNSFAPKLAEAEARHFLVACSAFVNYLKSKLAS